MIRPILTILSLGAVAVAACDDDNPSRSDTTDATTTPDTSDPDTSDPDTSDPDPDTQPDTQDPDTNIPNELEGTRLEAVGVTWTEPLVLCSAWLEGANREDELAHKIRVVVPPQTRTSLAEGALAAAPLVDVDLMRSPFAADRWVVDASSRAVTRWDLTTTEGYDELQATVTHDLGDLGELIETYGVVRSDELGTDIDAAAGIELSFHWSPPDLTTARLLEPCAVPDDYERAVQVLVASEVGGKETATVLRFFDTRHDELSAGSFPVRLEATQLVLGSDPWRVYEASGPWAHTYVAQHHNWYETTIVDFERDLSSWQTVFGPHADGAPIPAGTIARILFDDIGGDGTEPKLFLSRFGEDGTLDATEFDVHGEWHRVDANHLGRQLAWTCADGGVVGAVGFSDHVAQLMICPDDGGPDGKRLVGIVPVAWAGTPEVVGVMVDETGITETDDGWTASIGGKTMVVEPQADDAYLVDILDAGGESVGSSWSELYALTPQAGWDAHIEAASEDGAVTVRILRHWAAQGVGESAIYASDSVTLAWGDEVRTVEAWDAIRYTNTHHNWQDELTATTEDGHVLHWKVSYDLVNGTGLTHRVWVVDADGEEVLAPTIVTPIATQE